MNTLKEKNDHGLREKVSSFWKKTAKQLITLGIAAHLFLACSNENQIKRFTVQPWDTLIELIKNNLSLSEEQREDKTFVMQLVKKIQKENDIENSNYIKAWDVIVVNMSDIKKMTKEHKKNIPKREQRTIPKEEQRKIEEEQKKIEEEQKKIEKKQRKIEEEQKDAKNYSKISNKKEFNKSKDYLVVKMRNDSGINERIGKELENGYSIRVPKEREHNLSPALSIDEITKPDQILSNKLKGKKIVIDPGHGSMDIGAIGIAQYGNKENKEKIIVYEAPVVMDISYRVAKLIRSHGGEIVFTHYANRRGILDKKDLPPVSRSFDKWEEVYQDIWHGTNYNHPGLLFKQKYWLRKRVNISNNEKNTDLFVSFHADLIIWKDKINDKDKILSIKYDERGGTGGISKKRWEKILENGFQYSYNGKRAEDVKHDCTHQRLQVLRENKHPALLVELGNMSEPNQAFYLRSGDNRQKLAESFTDALIKSFNN